MRESLSGIADSLRRSLVVVMLVVDAIGRLRQSVVSRCSWKLGSFFISDRKFRKANRSQLNKSCFFKAKMHLQVNKKLLILEIFSNLCIYLGAIIKIYHENLQFVILDVRDWVLGIGH
jgi:hypothetical protein